MDEDYVIEEPGDQPVVVYNLPATEDAQNFECAYRFFENRQHDHLEMAWDGATREQAMANYLRERYYPRDYAPVDPGPAHARKPDLTTPMATTIVSRNTGLLLGTDPKIEMLVDEDSQAMLRCMYDSASLCLPFAQGRNMAGGGGATVLIPGIVGGSPTLTVGRPSEFKVLKWSDREPWQPERVIKQVLITRMVVDKQGNRRPKEFWQTTEWNTSERLEYKLVPKDWDPDEEIPLDASKPVYLHGCKDRCPVTWYKNSETELLLGTTDFAGLEPRIDAIDRLGTHLYTAVGNNCDPTAFHADEEGTRRRHLMSKRGRRVVVQLSDKGRIGVMEVAGTSLEITYKFWRGLQDDTFSLADCPRVTPDTAGAYKSGEALRILWRSSEVRARWLWPPLEKAMRRVLECLFAMAEHFGVSSYERPKAGTFILPSRVIPGERPPPKPRPALPPAPPPELKPGEPKPPPQPPMPAPVPQLAAPPEERPKPTLKPHKVGAYGFIGITPGPYFPSTSAEKQADLTTIQTAAGGSPVISQETAIEQAAKTLGIDADEEQRRVHEEAERSIDEFAGAAGLAAADGEASADAADDKARAKKAKPEDEPAEDDEI